MQVTCALGESVLAEVVELLRLQVEYRSLVVFLSRREVESPACSEIKRQAICEAPVILPKELKDVIARPKLALLKINLECIHLSEQKAGERIACVGHALLIRSRCGKGK